MNTLTSSFTELLWRHSWQLSVLILLTFILRFALRRHVSCQWLARLWVIPILLLAGATDKRAIAQDQAGKKEPPSEPDTTPILDQDPLINAITTRIRQRVEDTLKQATTRPQPTEAPFTWISQPGMIRTFGSSRAFTAAYPLYSTSQSSFSDPEELGASIKALASWKDHPDQMVDLNDPVDGQFPILDPRAFTEHQVEGFRVDWDQMPGSESGQRLPMPVPWLYQLKDGSLGALEDATTENPIVARVAYWTDDESCKINVNTASEGIPWDVPKVDTEEDRDFGKFQPGLTEFQRHPGHPATTCLSSVLFPNRSYHTDESDKRLTEAELKRIYDLAPRIVFHPRTPVTVDSPSHEQSLDKKPLYQSVDSVVSEAGEHTRGFLTAVSESPEITVHGTDRTGIWPLSRTRTDFDKALAAVTSDYHFLGRRSRSDSAYDSMADWWSGYRIATLASSPIPGYGGSLSNKTGWEGSILRNPQDGLIKDWENLREYDYLQILTSMADYVRQVSLHHPAAGVPFSSNHRDGYGQVTGLSRNASSNLIANHLENWPDTRPHPKGAGRLYTLSEAALVIYQTGQVRLKGWDGDQAVVDQMRGPDTGIIKRVLSNSHPLYQRVSKVFGPDDVGHTFGFIEVGLIPEVFCPSHGHDAIVPVQSMRLIHKGANLKLNGIPLELWGNAVGLPEDAEGPVVMSMDARSDRLKRDMPAGWYPWGGSGGVRLFRFGTFKFDESSPGFMGTAFLANGQGPLSHFYCQSTIILRDDEPLTLTQESPLKINVYDAIGEDAHLHNAVQQFRLRWAQPGQSFDLARPVKNSNMYSGWTRRFRGAAHAQMRVRAIPVLEPEFHETITSVTVSHGDYRHAAMKRQVPSELFAPHASRRPTQQTAHALTESGRNGQQITPGATFANDLFDRNLVAGVTYAPEVRPDFSSDVRNRATFAPLLDKEYQFPIDPTITRDFDNGIGIAPDGAYINKPDEGAPIENDGDIPYFDVPVRVQTPRSVTIPPLRKINSPVAFGSLPSTLQANAPWTTLLFRPNIALDPNRHPHLGEAGNGLKFLGHRETIDGFQFPRFASVHDDKRLPPDHLWLDLFWMPATEPAHLNKPSATLGKINMNYQMVPFPHIQRATGLHAVLKSERMLCIPTAAGQVYKTETRPTYRHSIDANETLKQFEEKFVKGEVFLTESEICEQFLIPKGAVWDEGGKTIRKFWDDHRLTGDNSLERPYSNLYPRLTTKSNVFRVHLRIQLFDSNTKTYTNDHRASFIVRRPTEMED